MPLFWGAVLLIILGGSLLLGHFHLTHHPPRCHTCRTPAEPMASHHAEGRIPVVEVAYWCPRCAQVISRRFVSPVWDW